MTYVGLDVGTSSVRAIAFGDDGNLVASSSQPVSTIHPGVDMVEQDPTALAALSVEVLRDLSERLPDVPRSIGIANQRETVVAWERSSNTPLQMAISWQDRRGSVKCEELKRAGAEPLVRDITGLTLDPYFSATKYSALASQFRGRDLAMGTVDSWLLANLTSSPIVQTDFTNASRTSLFNIDTNRYDDRLASMFNVPLELLPTPAASDSLFGEISHPDLGNWNGVPIHAVVGDQQASLFGQGCIDFATSKATLGTGTFILSNTGDKRLRPKHGLVASIAWNLSDHGNTYCLEGSILSTASALQWLIDVLNIAEDIDGLDALSKSVRGSEQVTVLPFFGGTGSPWWSEGASALIAGLETSSSKGQIARAAFESIALQVSDILTELALLLNDRLGSVRLDGGLSCLDSLCQLIADQSNLECHASLLSESTAFGAAMMSAVGIGDITPDNLKARFKARNSFLPSQNRIAAKSRSKRWNGYIAKLGLPDQ